jgi:hypothetical protein
VEGQFVDLPFHEDRWDENAWNWDMHTVFQTYCAAAAAAATLVTLAPPDLMMNCGITGVMRTKPVQTLRV